MLVLKKISIKKLTIYVSIIVLMLAGAGLMLYQNQRLTSRKPSTIADPARLDQFITIEAAGPGSATAPKTPLAAPPQASAEPGQPLTPGKINKGIDTIIFSSEKYKELKENVLIIQESSSLGKTNPFKPGQ